MACGSSRFDITHYVGLLRVPDSIATTASESFRNDQAARCSVESTREYVTSPPLAPLEYAAKAIEPAHKTHDNTFLTLQTVKTGVFSIHVENCSVLVQFVGGGGI